MTHFETHHEFQAGLPPAMTPERRIGIVGQAAEKALAKAEGRINAAAEELARMVFDDAMLNEALVEPLLRRACYDAVRARLQSDRARCWPPVSVRAVSGVERARIMAKSNLMAFVMPCGNGKLLRDCGRDEVEAAGAFYGTQADDMKRKQRWLLLVARALPEGATVGEALDEDRLVALGEQAHA